MYVGSECIDHFTKKVLIVSYYNLRKDTGRHPLTLMLEKTRADRGGYHLAIGFC